jgi:hypothetical protein
MHRIEFFGADAEVARDLHQFSDRDPGRFDGRRALAEIVAG